MTLTCMLLLYEKRTERAIRWIFDIEKIRFYAIVIQFFASPVKFVICDIRGSAATPTICTYIIKQKLSF